MRIARVETIPVSVPYTHREVSAQVARDGVSDVLVKVTTEEGLVGWGEACCGADTASVDAAVRAMAPFVIGRDPWNGDAMQRGTALEYLHSTLPEPLRTEFVSHLESGQIKTGPSLRVSTPPRA